MVEPTSPQSPRKIAEEAGTNIASINTYFRSKDLAVEEALSLALKNSNEDIEAIIADESRSFEQTMETLLEYLIAGSLRFPGVTMAHMYPVLMEKRVDTFGARMFQRMFEHLVTRAAHDLPGKSPESVRVALAQVLSAATFVTVAPGLFMPMTPIDITTPDGPPALAKYLTALFIRGVDIPAGG